MSKVVVLSLCNQFGQELTLKAFSSIAKAERWIQSYVKSQWFNYFQNPCPDDLDEAVDYYFYGGVVEGENLSYAEVTVDEKDCNND